MTNNLKRSKRLPQLYRVNIRLAKLNKGSRLLIKPEEKRERSDRRRSRREDY